LQLRFENGAVASSHPLASRCGSKVLEAGGNVVDAAIATSAMLCVTQNNLCGLGGDLFALAKLNGGIRGLNGSGGAAKAATRSFYKEKKLANIPTRGPLSAITVPGLVDAWEKLLSRFGSFELSTLLKPAIEAAENGFAIGSKYASSIEGSMKTLGAYQNWKEIFCPSGAVPSIGINFKQADLGRTLKAIATEGTSSFYSGHLSERIVRGIEAGGGILSDEDFENYSATWDQPLKTTYRGLTIFETAPNSQGATVLLWLNMLENFDLSNIDLYSDEFLKIYIDTCLKSYSERAKSIGDPNYLPFPSQMLSKEFSRELLHSEDITSALNYSDGVDRGDTTYFCVMSSNGDCVSAIQSNYMGFGSGLVPKGTGFVLNNRGCYFSLDPSHHNSLFPGKRTFHTLCACLAEKENGDTAFCLGSMGGDVQPQVQIQLLTAIVDHRLHPQEAIDSPRRVIPFTIYERPSEVLFEPGSYSDKDKISQITKRMKLKVETLPSLSPLTGHAQSITMGQDGWLHGGADPRGEGEVSGY
jgi:gamma-glutamyltranspeptidase